MNAIVFSRGDLGVTWSALIVLAACAQWLVFLVMRLVARGEQGFDKRLMMSSAVFALAWVVVLTPNVSQQTNPVTAASVVPEAAPQGSCASISIGMGAARARNLMGTPDEVRSDAETRGPGSEMWIYRSSRCTVHVLDEVVEFVD